ncbi:MAG: hypothetical protein ACKO9D_00355 [Gammaproteobacteria bacterium]
MLPSASAIFATSPVKKFDTSACAPSAVQSTSAHPKPSKGSCRRLWPAASTRCSDAPRSTHKAPSDAWSIAKNIGGGPGGNGGVKDCRSGSC